MPEAWTSALRCAAQCAVESPARGSCFRHDAGTAAGVLARSSLGRSPQPHARTLARRGHQYCCPTHPTPLLRSGKISPATRGSGTRALRSDQETAYQQRAAVQDPRSRKHGELPDTQTRRPLVIRSRHLSTAARQPASRRRRPPRPPLRARRSGHGTSRTHEVPMFHGSMDRASHAHVYVVTQEQLAENGKAMAATLHASHAPRRPASVVPKRDGPS